MKPHTSTRGAKPSSAAMGCRGYVSPALCTRETGGGGIFPGTSHPIPRSSRPRTSTVELPPSPYSPPSTWCARTSPGQTVRSAFVPPRSLTRPTSRVSPPPSPPPASRRRPFSTLFPLPSSAAECPEGSGLHMTGLGAPEGGSISRLCANGPLTLTFLSSAPHEARASVGRRRCCTEYRFAYLPTRWFHLRKKYVLSTLVSAEPQMYNTPPSWTHG